MIRIRQIMRLMLIVMTIFMAISGYLLAFFFAVGIITFIGRLLNIGMSFESTMYIVGFGVGVGSWAGMAHDLTDAILGYLRIIDMAWYEQQLNQNTIWRGLLLTCYSLYFLWIYLMFYKGIRATSNSNKVKSAVLSLLAIICFQGVLLIFIR